MFVAGVVEGGEDGGNVEREGGFGCKWAGSRWEEEEVAVGKGSRLTLDHEIGHSPQTDWTTSALSCASPVSSSVKVSAEAFAAPLRARIQ